MNKSSWWNPAQLVKGGTIDKYGPLGQMILDHAIRTGGTVFAGSCRGILEDNDENGQKALLTDLVELTAAGTTLTEGPIFGRGTFDSWVTWDGGAITIQIGLDGKITAHVACLDEKLYMDIAAKLGEHLLPDHVRQPVYSLAEGANGIEIVEIGTAGEGFERGNYMDDVVEGYDFIISDLQRDPPMGRLTILEGEPGCGKCVAKGTLIMDASTGLLRPVEEIVARQSKVPTFSKEKGVVFTTPLAWLKTGVKACLRLVTKPGHELEATPEHPFLTPDGWRRLDQIEPGMYVAAAASIPFPEETVRIPDEHVTLLAALLAEGNYTQNFVGFTNDDPEIVAVVNESLKCIEGELRQYKNHKRFEYRVISPLEGRTSKIRLLLDKYGMGHKKATEKTVPEVVFRLGHDQLAKFIGMVWSGDGSISKSGVITLGLASEVLIDQIQHLLLRLGIRTTKRSKVTKCKYRQFHSWELTVTGTTRQRFAEAIPLTGEKAQRLRNLVFGQSHQVDLVPMTDGVRKAIQEAADKHRERGGSFEGMREWLGWENTKNEHVLLRRDHASKRVLEAFARVTGAEELLWLNRVRWEKVRSVEPVGDREVYDLTVPGTHCFVANDLVAHNTFFVRGLIDEILDAVFVLIPPHLVEGLSGPQLVPTLVRARGMAGSSKPIVLIIEDADHALVPREEGSLSAISSLLNVSDGILGHALNVRVLCTTNAKVEDIDPALNRARRLSKRLHIGPLTKEKAAEVYGRITEGEEVTFEDEEIPLAEVYNFAHQAEIDEEDEDDEFDDDDDDDDDEFDDDEDDEDDD